MKEVEFYELYDAESNILAWIEDGNVIKIIPYDDRYVFGGDIQDGLDTGDIVWILQKSVRYENV